MQTSPARAPGKGCQSLKPWLRSRDGPWEQGSWLAGTSSLGLRGTGGVRVGAGVHLLGSQHTCSPYIQSTVRMLRGEIGLELREDWL